MPLLPIVTVTLAATAGLFRGKEKSASGAGDGNIFLTIKKRSKKLLRFFKLPLSI
jgi:hypothetical protein